MFKKVQRVIMWYAMKIFFDFRRQDNEYMYLKKKIVLNNNFFARYFY